MKAVALQGWQTGAALTVDLLAPFEYILPVGKVHVVLM